MPVEKACPIVLRPWTGNGDISLPDAAATEILAFEHPEAGLQLVKGTIEPGETPQQAARRELWEESGLVAGHVSPLLTTRDLPDADVWHFYVCRVDPAPPEAWTHWTDDDGGHEFRFFWHPLDARLSSSWHPLFVRVLATVRKTLCASLRNDLAGRRD